MHRSNQLELLDGDNIPTKDLRRNLYELDVINTWLGGHAITLKGLQEILLGKKVNKRLHICEIGCGGGDNLVAIAKWCKRKGIGLKVTGIDMKEDCIGMARERFLHVGDVVQEWICSDYRAVDLRMEKPEVVFSSLFCHHFKEQELVEMMRWKREQSRWGFFINDLHRHVLAMSSIALLTKLFSKSYLVKHDAPLSVRRGLLRKEWETILKASGTDGAKIRWAWAFRWLITYVHSTSSYDRFD